MLCAVVLKPLARARVFALLTVINLILFAAFQARNLDFVKGDFRMFYAAASALRAGAPIYGADFHGGPLGWARAYTHPAYELLIFLPLTWLPYRAACWLWLVLIFGLALLCSRLLTGGYWSVAAAAPFLFVMLELQDSMLLLLAVIGCWLALCKRRDVGAGLILALALFRFPIVLPLAILLAAWRPKLLAGFAAAGSVVLATSIALAGWAGTMTYWHWLSVMAASKDTTTIYHNDATRQMTARGLATALSLGPIGAVVIACLILVAAICLMRSRQANAETKFSVAVIAGLLLSGHLMVHDMVLLCVPFALLASEARWPLAAFYVPGFCMLMLFAPVQEWSTLLLIASLVMIASQTIRMRDERHSAGCSPALT